MNVNGVEYVAVPAAVRDEVLANFDEIARSDPDNAAIAARAVATVTGLSAAEIVERGLAAAGLTKPKRVDRFRRKVRESVKATRDEKRKGYVAAKLDEASLQAEIDESAHKELVRRAGKARADEIEHAGSGDADPYVVIADLGDDITPPTASAGMVRDDGVFTLVAREWSAHNGHPGAFKSGLAALHAVETLKRGRRVAWYDTDGNSAQAVVSRLLAAGAPLDVLRDRDRFRLTINDSPATLLATVPDAVAWLTSDDLVVMDAAGGLVAAFGGNSNDADDWMRIYQQLLAPLVSTGAAGLLIDHFAKTATGTGYATGTGAKLKSLHGIVYSVESWKNEPPRPESVGKVTLTLVKDTHGATGYAVGDPVAVLEIDSRDAANGPWSWRLMPCRPRDERDASRAEADVDIVLALDPFPTSRDKLHAALIATEGKGWRADREHAALTEARRRRELSKTPEDIATINQKGTK